MRTIFVYGLLKPGFTYHGLAAPFVVDTEPAHVSGRLFDAGVPAARFDQTGTITGYVYWLHEDRVDEALTAFDDLEDEGEHYRRVRVTAHTPTGAVEAYAYEYLLDLSGARYVGESWPRS